MTPYLAQQLIIQPSGGTPVSINGPLVGINKLSDLIGVITTFLTPLAAIILFLIISWGGYDLLLSSGDPERVQSGQQKITAGIIGFILLVLSFFLSRLLGQIFGVGGGIL